MFSRFFAVVIILIVVYTLGIFLFPNQTDTYGNVAINTWVRSFKQNVDSISLKDPKTIAQSIQDSLGEIASTASGLVSSGTSLVDETKKTYENSKKIIETKIDQLNTATDSVKKAYTAVNEAKENIQNLTNLSGTSIPK